jgi:pimeloyl-ACP methyl ester carboxylesterase
MARPRSRRSRKTFATLIPVATAAGVYLAERRAIARWSEADRFRGEPLALSGQQRWVDGHDGARLRVVEAGDGPPVILAHGFTSTSDHWGPVAARLLDRGYRVIAFDQRGHGGSTSGSGRFRPTDFGNDLAAVVAATAPTGAVLVGHSMGGIGIQAMLIDHEEARRGVRAVVLVATLARPASVPLGKLMARLGGTALAARVMAHRVHGRILARGGVGDEPAVTLLDVIRNGWATCPGGTRVGVMRDLVDFDFSERLRATETPVTVVAGDLDQVTPHDENRHIANVLPNGRLDTVPGVGHAAHWEAADRVAEIVAAYITTNAR